MFNATTTAQTVANTLKSFGMKVVVTRLGTPVGNTFGVWGGGEIKNQTSGVGGMQTDVVSNISAESKILYLPANMNWKPQVGDDLAVGTSSWRIAEVQVYQPGLTPVAYKVSMS